MKVSTLSIIVLFLLQSCMEVSDPFFVDEKLSTETRAPKQKITVCHLTGNGSFHAIEINENALPAHLAHGDGFPGSCYENGYYLTEECELIYVENNLEVCDGIDNDCNGLVDDNCVSCPCFVLQDILDNAAAFEVYAEPPCTVDDYYVFGPPFERFFADVVLLPGEFRGCQVVLGGIPNTMRTEQDEADACAIIIQQAQQILNLPLDECVTKPKVGQHEKQLEPGIFHIQNLTQ